MILQKLVNFYEHKEKQGEIAPYGWEWKAIPFLIQLNSDGSFSALIDTRENPKDTGKLCLIPKTLERSGKNSWQTTFLLWDHIGYVLGLVTDKEKEETVKKQHNSFKQKLQDLPEALKEDKGINAVIQFLDKADFTGITKDKDWEYLFKKKPNVTFQLSGDDEIIAQRPVIKQHVTESAVIPNEKAYIGKCLITGEETAIARTHSKIKGVYGAQTSGAAIVSFNDSAYTSHGKKQNYNAPISEYAAFAYTTALNHLLRKGSNHRLQIGDTSIVFWTATSHPIESAVSDLFGWEADKKTESPRDLDSIRALLLSHQTGAKPVLDDETEFYVLGLSPNASRLSIRFWHSSTVREMAQRFLDYFADIEIVTPPKFPPFPSLKRLLNTMALLQKSENLPPQLSGAFIRAIFEDKPFPRYALNLALNRERAETNEKADPYRIALIKAILIRAYNRKELTMSLNEEITDIGYRLGRLFCVLEQAQQYAHKPRDLNRTIRESFYGSASTSPLTVFPRLMSLYSQHLKKIKSKGNYGMATYYENSISTIMDGIDARKMYPTRLSLEQQGLFSVGYYQQRTKPSKQTDANTEIEQGA